MVAMPIRPSDDDAPTAVPPWEPRPARRWPRRLAWSLAALLAAVIAAGTAFTIYLDRSLTRVEVVGLAEASDRPAPTPPPDDHEDDEDAAVDARDDALTIDDDGLDEAVTLLLLGSDDRSTLSEEDRHRLGVGETDGARTEAIILARIDPAAADVQILRFPRDLVVQRCDGSTGRINAAYAIGEEHGIGGASCVVQTITDWTGIPIDHAATVDFAGFVDLVDTVGGITVDVPRPLVDPHANLDVDAGEIEMDGALALAYARARRVDDDFGRIDRQNQLLGALLDEVLTPALLTDPGRSLGILTSALDSLEIDQGLTRSRIQQLGVTATSLDADDLVTRTVPGSPTMLGEAAVLVPEEPVAAELFTAFTEGRLGATDDPGTPDDVVEDDPTDDGSPS